MKKYVFYLCLLFFLPSILFSKGKELLTVSDIYESEKFSGEHLRKAQWMPGGDAFTFLETDETDSITSIYKHVVETGEVSLFVNGNDLYLPETGEQIQIDSYCWSDDGSKILIQSDTMQIWRHSQESRYYVYDANDHKIQAVFDGEEMISTSKISPDGRMVGYVFKNNIYTKNLLTDDTKQWTEDGSDVIINGQFDWVYEEEFSIADGWQWSPDSKKIAFWRLDQSPEPQFSWIDYNPLHQSIITIRYPKVGEKNALVKIGVIHLDTGRTVWMDTGEEPDIYIPRIQWTSGSNILSIQRLNRYQNQLELLQADVETGKTTTILTETDPCWVDVHDNLVFLKDKEQFIWTSEKSGYNHIYLYQNDGSLIRQLTEGDWEVKTVYGVDEDSGFIFYSSNQEDVAENHIYKVHLTGKEGKRITKGQGWNSAYFSPDFRYFINSYSNVETPEQSILYSSHGEEIRILVKNEMSVLDDYDISYPRFLKIKTEDGEELNAWMIKPLDFNENKKYPVLIYCYGLPGGQVVRDKWIGEDLLWYNLLAQRGYITFRLDNRGSEGRGKAFVNLAYGNLGKWAVNDQIQGAKYLSGLSYVDKDRIGIWGWSGGGYVTLLAMTYGADYFKTGVAVAPVTCFRLYDNIWAERYMGLPEENEEGYDATSVFSYVDRLKGNLLIIHGLADDNVHVQNTMQLVEELQSHGKQFTLMLYPSENHMLSGDNTAYHMFTVITDFILENL